MHRGKHARGAGRIVRPVALAVASGLALPLLGCASLGGLLEPRPSNAIVRPSAPADYDFLVARELEGDGDLAGATAAYTRAVVKDPDSPFLRRELAQVGRVQRIGRADVQRDAVEHHRDVGAEGLDDAARPSAARHVVLGDRLEEARAERAALRAGQDLARVGSPEADADAQEGRLAQPSFSIFSLAALQSSGVIIL